MNWVSIDMEGQVMMSNCVGDVERATKDNTMNMSENLVI
jgi:hypothetical protein